MTYPGIQTFWSIAVPATDRKYLQKMEIGDIRQAFERRWRDAMEILQQDKS
jgi:hypothetical protein